MNRVLNDIILKDERHMHIICMFLRFGQRRLGQKIQRGLRKKYDLSIFSELKKKNSLTVKYHFMQDDKP